MYQTMICESSRSMRREAKTLAMNTSTNAASATRAAITNANRSAATQRVVDRYASDPAAKNARSLALADAHGLTARIAAIERDAETGAVTRVTCDVPSQSKPRVAHHLFYSVLDDAALCDCAAGVNGLPCGHAGATLRAGRALVRADALLRAQREAIQREAAAWHAALDAMEAHENARRAAAHAREEAAQLYRNPRPFSMWRSDDAD